MKHFPTLISHEIRMLLVSPATYVAATLFLAFMGLIFTSLALGIPALGFAFLMMFLELFVAVLQAFIFAVLAAVFIGQIRSAHH